MYHARKLSDNIYILPVSNIFHWILKMFRQCGIFCFLYFIQKEEFEDSKEVIKIRISKKNRQHNGQRKKVQKDKQRSTIHTHKTKDRVTRTALRKSLSSSSSTNFFESINKHERPIFTKTIQILINKIKNINYYWRHESIIDCIYQLVLTLSKTICEVEQSYQTK